MVRYLRACSYPQLDSVLVPVYAIIFGIVFRQPELDEHVVHLITMQHTITVDVSMSEEGERCIFWHVEDVHHRSKFRHCDESVVVRIEDVEVCVT